MEKAEQNRLVIVYPEAGGRAGPLLRAAKKKASDTGVPWEAVYIQSDPEEMRDTEVFARILQNLTLAEQMGATVVSLDNVGPEKAILKLMEEYIARGTTVTHLFVAKNNSGPLVQCFRKSIAKRLKAVLPPDIEIMEVAAENAFTPSGIHRSFIGAVQAIRTRHLFYAFTAVLAAAFIREALILLMPSESGDRIRIYPMLYTAAAVLTAARTGTFPGIVATGAGYIIMRFLYPFENDQNDIGDITKINLLVYLATTLGITAFVGNIFLKKENLKHQMHRLQALFRMYRVSLKQRDRNKMVPDLHRELTAAFGGEIIFFLISERDQKKIETVFPPDVTLSEEDQKALAVCHDEAKVTGYGSPYNPGSYYRFIPLPGSDRLMGMVAIHINENMTLDTVTRDLMTSIADHVAFIFERFELGSAMEESRIREEREKLRSMLLCGVSHDLKTPLASVIGSLSVYRSMKDYLPEEHRVTLIDTALEEARRLDSFITNILDMTRIESGRITFKKEWITPGDLIKDVRKRLRGRLLHHTVLVKSTEDNKIEVQMDGMMTAQVLQNILDNAGKYTPPDTVVEVEWGTDEAGFFMTVSDTGPGIPEGGTERIFDKYERIARQDNQVAGTGLGLAISRAVMEAQGGGISASNRPGGGAVFTLRFPVWRIPAPSGEKEAHECHL